MLFRSIESAVADFFDSNHLSDDQYDSVLAQVYEQLADQLEALDPDGDTSFHTTVDGESVVDEEAVLNALTPSTLEALRAQEPDSDPSDLIADSSEQLEDVGTLVEAYLDGPEDAGLDAGLDGSGAGDGLEADAILDDASFDVGQAVDEFVALNSLSDRKSTRLNSSHSQQSRMPSSA